MKRSRVLRRDQRRLRWYVAHAPVRTVSVLALTIVIGIVGVYLVAASHAATPTASVEPEAGTVTSPASVVSDTGASAGKAVKFSTGGSAVTFNRCTNPVYTLVADNNNPQNGYTLSGYYVTNDNWNFTKYPTSTQTMYICDYNNWYVNVNVSDTANNGEVKTYPNVHKDFNDPAVSSFHTISSTFAHTAPSYGAWDIAYDVWFNGLNTELMIWTQSAGRQAHVPGIPTVGTTTIGGQNYTIHKSGSYIAYDMPSTVTSGTVDILAIMNDMISRGYLKSTDTLTQIDYGFEVCDVGGVNTKFELNNFSVTTN